MKDSRNSASKKAGKKQSKLVKTSFEVWKEKPENELHVWKFQKREPKKERQAKKLVKILGKYKMQEKK